MERNDDTPEDNTDLVQLLVLEAGRLLEGASTDFAMTLPVPGLGRAEKLSQLTVTVMAAQTLLGTAILLDGLGT